MGERGATRVSEATLAVPVPGASDYKGLRDSK